MIKNWPKYEAFRGDVNFIRSLKRRFSSLLDDDFYDLFQDSLLLVFPVFEELYNPEIGGNENGFLYILIYRAMIDKLNREIKTTALPDIEKKLESDENSEDQLEVESQDQPEVEIDSKVPVWTFSDFLKKLLRNRSDIKPLKPKVKGKRARLPKYSEIHPLIKMQAWSSDKKLSAKEIHTLANKIYSDTKSHHYYEWKEPMPIVRIKCWVGCI